MKPFTRRRLGWMVALLAMAAAAGESLAQTPSASAAYVDTATSHWNSEDDDDDRHPHRHHHVHHGNDVVSIGHDSVLDAGKRADSVVSVLGSSTSAGEAEDVVSVFGNTRVTGPVANGVVSVFGSTYVDSKVQDAVAVLGNVELGPNAEVDGDVVAVLGHITRAPGAIVHGSEQNIVGFGGIDWLGEWIHKCLFYGRLLALDAGLGWAWFLAIGYLALYVLLATLFRSALTRCVRMVDSEPGHSALSALLAVLLTPVVVVLLCVTLIGIAAIPFLAAAIFCMGLFGKAVMLAWIGDRVAGQRLGPTAHPAAAVLIGGVLVLLLYVVPVVGMLTFQLLGFFGFGAVLYALILNVQARRGSAAHAANTAQADAPALSIGAASAASPAAPFISAALPRAGFWIRMGALLIDVVVIGIVTSLLNPFGHFHLLLLAVYGAVLWKLKGSTIGASVFDLRVVRLDGREVDWETAIVRALSCFLSLAVAGLGFIWIAIDGANQAWHDKIAGTVVVRVPKA